MYSHVQGKNDCCYLDMFITLWLSQLLLCEFILSQSWQILSCTIKIIMAHFCSCNKTGKQIQYLFIFRTFVLMHIQQNWLKSLDRKQDRSSTWMHRFYSRTGLNGNHWYFCKKKSKQKQRQNIDIMYCWSHLFAWDPSVFFSIFTSFLWRELGGLKVSPGCTSHVNFLAIAHFAVTLSAEVFSLRAFSPEHHSVNMCRLLSHCQCCAQTPTPSCPHNLGCAPPCTSCSLAKGCLGTFGYFSQG